MKIIAFALKKIVDQPVVTGISLLIWGYVLLRAFSVGITYDEAWTIQAFVPLEWMHILNLTPVDANNHIVNTLLIKFFFLFGNHSLFVARLPNVLAFVLYLYYIRKICFHFLNKQIALLTFLLMVSNPFLLDFYSLARGYGLSIAFLSGALWFLLRFLSDNRAIAVFWSLLFANLSVLGNFSTLNVWVSLAGVFLFILLLKRKTVPVGNTLVSGLIALIILFTFAYEPIRKLNKYGSFYYGGDQDFFHDTVLSLTNYSFYSPDLQNWMILVAVIVLLFFVSTLFLKWRKSGSFLTPEMILLVVLLLAVSSVIVQHVLLGTLYLIDRTALFFVPLFILTLAFFVNRLLDNRLIIGFYFIFAIFSMINFIVHANLYKTATWYFDAHTKALLAEINDQAKSNGNTASIDFVWPFQSAINFYLPDYSAIKSMHREEERVSINVHADYIFFLNHRLDKVGYEPTQIVIDTSNYELYRKFPGEFMYVYKRK